MKRESKIFMAITAAFAVIYFIPLENSDVTGAIINAFALLQEYAREHTLTCVVPALFIAGAITTFMSQAAVLKYMGPGSNKLVAYCAASISGAILSVCSCTVLPIFAGIYAAGAGLGPATAFLYSGPAINVLAIFLTARVLGMETGVARAVGAIAFAFVTGLAMAAIFRKSEKKKQQVAMQNMGDGGFRRLLWQTIAILLAMVGVLIFAAWGRPQDAGSENWAAVIYGFKWYIAGLFLTAVLLMTWRWSDRRETGEWMQNTWDFSKRLLPLLFGGVFLAGFVEHLVSQEFIAEHVGDNSFLSNMVAGVAGAMWYFATLTEVPICESLRTLGMHNGPLLTLLLAGPALSLPNMLVIRSVMGNLKTLVFVVLVVIVAVFSGMIFGMFF